MHRDLTSASALTLFLLAPYVPAQSLSGPTIGLNGGQQSLTWTANCSNDLTFQNNTLVSLAGLWINVDLVGQYDPPDIGAITIDAGGTRIWDVDDNEDLDNDDASENDVFDSTPDTPLATNGWHRVQARTTGDVVAAGATFTLRLCDSNGNPLSTPTARTVTLIPITQRPGQVGGDLGLRVSLPISLNKTNATGFATLASSPPPGSTDFSLAMTNENGYLTYRKVIVSPPSGVTVLNASASGGGTFEGGLRAIVWPTPIPAGCIEQLYVSLDGLNLTTSVAFTSVLKLQEK